MTLRVTGTLKLAVITAFAFLLAAEAKSTLRSSLKLAGQNKTRDPYTFTTHEDVKNYRIRRFENDYQHQLQQEPEEPVFKEYVKPFTASPYYDFFDAFLLGLKLETFFSGSDNCIMSAVYVVDDWFYLQNNISDF